jgi:mRNA interferase MazF
VNGRKAADTKVREGRDKRENATVAARPRPALKIARYGLYLADLNPTRGSEIAKIRPVVVVSHDAMNRAIETVVICPLTSALHPSWRTRIACVCAGKRAEIAMDQIRTIAKQRLIRRVGSVETEVAWAIRSLIVEMYGTE